MTCPGEEGTGEGFLDQITEQQLDPGRGWGKEGRKEAVTDGGQVLTL